MSLRISRKSDYALVALAALSQQEETQGDANQALSARQIAQAYQLPTRLLMNLLKRLGSAGLVISRRGASGGYRLARPADQITVAQVVLAIEGPMRLTLCCDEEERQGGQACTGCQLTVSCPIEQGIRQLNDAMFDMLGQVTLDDLLRQQLPTIVRPTRRQAASSAGPQHSTRMVHTTTKSSGI